MSAVHDGKGAALKNEAAEILRVTETPGGPVTIAVHSLDGAKIVPAVSRLSDGAHVALAEETAVAGEATGYTGDTSDTDFTGQDLNTLPIVPGTLTVKPTTGGASVNATDRDGDGKLYTADVDENECGTIDYFTGALVLAYPTGKEPNTGAISADYSHVNGVEVAAGGKKTYQVTNLQAAASADFEGLIVKAAGDVSGRVRVEAYQSF